jgi:hypothetical protein
LFEHASGNYHVIHRGEVLESTHEAVLRNPQFFAIEALTRDEILARHKECWPDLDNMPEPAPSPTHLPRQLKDEDACVALRRLGTYPVGCEAGERRPATDRIVRENPEAFVAVATKGVKRERALVAPTNLSQTDAEGNERTVIGGTWLDQDDPLVKLHPLLQWRRPT